MALRARPSYRALPLCRINKRVAHHGVARWRHQSINNRRGAALRLETRGIAAKKRVKSTNDTFAYRALGCKYAAYKAAAARVASQSVYRCGYMWTIICYRANNSGARLHSSIAQRA